MSNTDRTNEHLRSLAPWALARSADCLDPDSPDSAGAAFLTLVRDSVAEDWDRLTERDDDPDHDGAVSEIAEGCVPTYTHDLWATFVDLGAYDEDVTDHGPIESLDQAARVALYTIAIRLVYALVDEGKELANEEGED